MKRHFDIQLNLPEEHDAHFDEIDGFVIEDFEEWSYGVIFVDDNQNLILATDTTLLYLQSSERYNSVFDFCEKNHCTCLKILYPESDYKVTVKVE